MTDHRIQPIVSEYGWGNEGAKAPVENWHVENIEGDTLVFEHETGDFSVRIVQRAPEGRGSAFAIYDSTGDRIETLSHISPLDIGSVKGYMRGINHANDSR